MWLPAGALLVVALAATRVHIVEPRVHVRWSDDLGAVARAYLERRYDLRDGAPATDSSSTWHYRLFDRSTGNIRALVNDPSVKDTGYIDRRTFTTTDAREYVFIWWPLSDLFSTPADLLRLHQSLWLLLAGGSLLIAAGGALPVRRGSTITAVAIVAAVAVAAPLDRQMIPMGGSDGRLDTREHFEFFYGGRVRFEKHLSQVFLLEWYRRDPSAAAPDRAMRALTHVGTAWFFLSALLVSMVEGWSPHVVRYIALVLIAPTTLLFFGWREPGYLSLSAAVFPLLARGLRERNMTLELGSALAGFGAALHGSGLVTLASALTTSVAAPNRLGERVRCVLRVAAWGTAAYAGWLVLYAVALRLPISPDPGPAAFSSWRFWSANELRGGHIAWALLSRVTLRDLLFSAWVVGAPLAGVAVSLWRRQRNLVNLALWYAVPSVVFTIFRWPYDGVGGGMDLVAAGFPAFYALAWVSAVERRRAVIAALLLVTAHYAFWRIVLDRNFIPLP